MTTRAIQIELLLGGVIDSTTGDPLVEGTVEFYAAGTTTPKNVWTEKEKTNAYTSITLDTIGQRQIYGEGVYKLVIKDSDGSTIYTWDNIKLKANNFYVRTITSNDTATTDDDVILADTGSGDITVTMPAAADMEHPIIVKNIGANSVIIDPNESETIDGDATFTMPSENMYIIIFSDGSNLFKGLTGQTKLEDVDGDTLIQVEESDDEDIIRMDVGGTEAVNISATGIDLSVGGTEMLSISSDGEITKPLQPAFLVTMSDTMSNIAIGTTTIQFNTERFGVTDRGSCFDITTYTFTAPVTGTYQFNVAVYCTDVDSAATGLNLTLVTSNRTYYDLIGPDLFSSDQHLTLKISTLADMDAADTAYVQITQAGGIAQMDISPTGSNFSGYLVA